MPRAGLDRRLLVPEAADAHRFELFDLGGGRHSHELELMGVFRRRERRARAHEPRLAAPHSKPRRLEAQRLPRIADARRCIQNCFFSRFAPESDATEIDDRRRVHRAPRVGVGLGPKTE
jgi:hypothetical protein